LPIVYLRFSSRNRTAPFFLFCSSGFHKFTHSNRRLLVQSPPFDPRSSPLQNAQVVPECPGSSMSASIAPARRGSRGRVKAPAPEPCCKGATELNTKTPRVTVILSKQEGWVVVTVPWAANGPAPYLTLRGL
jgi:hypothetical protein